MAEDLRAPLPPQAVHLCIDMQRLFSSDGPWPTPWMERVLPTVVRLVERHPGRTLFTRFVPPYRPEDMSGAWRAYFERWRLATREFLAPELLELVSPLERLAQPGSVFDKPVYSAFSSHRLREVLVARRCDTLILTGAETDMCVLATVLGAVDRGYRVVMVSDAVCSSSDKGHDALLELYRERFSLQIEAADSATVLAAWP